MPDQPDDLRARVRELEELVATRDRARVASLERDLAAAEAARRVGGWHGNAPTLGAPYRRSSSAGVLPRSLRPPR